MSGLFGVVDHDPDSAVRFERMAASLRRHCGQVLERASAGPYRVGLWRHAHLPETWCLERPERDLVVCLAGEIFSTRHPLPHAERPTAEFCLNALVDAFELHGESALRGLNGDFQVAVWDGRGMRITIAVDRFATNAMYWASGRESFTFAYGVRGVVAATDRSPRPDPDAIREAVTFGGFRLGARTNVMNVRALRPAETISWTDGSVRSSTYWSLTDVPASNAASLDDAVDAVHAAWQAAIRRRIEGARHPSQTLSGGRDSRVILAAAAPQTPAWQAVTYGVAGCDDARFAERAARVAGVKWVFAPLYDRTPPDWLERRTAEVQHTDGLIDLSDLMHLEHQGLLTRDTDCHLHGYIGDLVVGMTYQAIATDEEALIASSFTGASLAWDWHTALAALRGAARDESRALPRALLLEHKLPQAIARPAAALAAWVPVRRPFLDLDLFDTAISIRGDIRTDLYDRWVTRYYPQLFRHIPVQKTGVPAGSGALRVVSARAAREVRRRARAALQAVGRPVAPWSRNYTADEAEWSRPGVRERISETILRRDSLCCDLWGRDAVTACLDRWFAGDGGSAKVIGALYVWEAYHRDLPAFLRRRIDEVGE